MEKPKSLEELIRFSNMNAIQMIKREKFDEAQGYLDKCLAILESETVDNRSSLLGITYNNYGCLYKRQGLLENSLIYFQKALNHCKGVDLNLPEIYLNISNVLSQTFNHKSALVAGLKALHSLPAANKETLTAALIYKAVAIEYKYLGMKKEFIASISTGIKLSKRVLGNDHDITKSLMRMINKEKKNKPGSSERLTALRIQSKSLIKQSDRTPKVEPNRGIVFSPIGKIKEQKVKAYRSVTPTLMSEVIQKNSISPRKGFEKNIFCQLCKPNRKKIRTIESDKLLPVPRRYKLRLIE